MRTLLVLASFSVVATLGSCLSLETEAKLRFPYVDIGGIYPNTLSIDDIRDIIALARSRPGSFDRHFPVFCLRLEVHVSLSAQNGHHPRSDEGN
jgi:hypothetical protein